eukprot:gene2750-biopygen14139
MRPLNPTRTPRAFYMEKGTRRAHACSCARGKDCRDPPHLLVKSRRRDGGEGTSAGLCLPTTAPFVGNAEAVQEREPAQRGARGTCAPRAGDGTLACAAPFCSCKTRGGGGRRGARRRVKHVARPAGGGTREPALQPECNVSLHSLTIPNSYFFLIGAIEGDRAARRAVSVCALPCFGFETGALLSNKERCASAGRRSRTLF